MYVSQCVHYYHLLFQTATTYSQLNPIFVMGTMYLWNWLVPDLFHGPQLDFWQTLGLLILSKIFFSGFGKGGHRHNNKWSGYWKQKWNTMSPEEKERFKQKMKEKWCYRTPDSQNTNANG